MANEVTPKIETFFAGYPSRSYAKGQILILNGDDTTYVYHLKEGKVKVYDVSYRGDEVILNVFKPPAFFPMSLAINKTANPYIYEAETDIVVHQAPADEVVVFVKTNPDVMFDLLSRLYRGVDGLLGRMAHLMASSARGRLLYELMIEARRFGKSLAGGSIVLDVNEADLGARAGLSRETVSREINKLKADALIEVHAKEIVVRDLATLEQKLGTDL